MTEVRTSPGLRRIASQVALVTVAARVAGLLRWVAFALAVGASGVGTVYQNVNAVPNLVYEVVAGGVLAAVVVPLVASARRTGRADEVGSSLLTLAVVLLLPVTLVLALGAPWLSRVLLDGVEAPGAAELGTRLLVLFSPQVVLYGIGVVVAGVLQAHERLLAAALAPLLSSLVVIGTYLAYAWGVESTPAGTAVLPTAGWVVLGVGTTLGVAVLSLPLLVVAARAGIRLRPRWALTVQDRTRARQLAGAGLVGLVAQQLALVAVIRVANRSGGDAVFVVYQYAQAVYLLPYAVLAVPVATTAFARLAGDPDGEGAARTLNSALRVVLALSGAAAAALVAGAPGVGTVFGMLDRSAGRGEPGRAPLEAMPQALATTAVGLVGFSLVALALRALLVRGSARRAGWSVAAGWAVLAVVPALWLSRADGPAETLTVIGASSAVGMTLSAALLLHGVRRAWGEESTSGLLRLTGAVAVGVALGGACALGLVRADLTGAAQAGAAAGLGVVCAALCAALALAVDPTLREAVRRRR